MTTKRIEKYNMLVEQLGKLGKTTTRKSKEELRTLEFAKSMGEISVRQFLRVFRQTTRNDTSADRQLRR